MFLFVFRIRVRMLRSENTMCRVGRRLVEFGRDDLGSEGFEDCVQSIGVVCSLCLPYL